MTDYEILWDFMVDLEIATNDELILATTLCGNTLATLTSVLFIRTGNTSIDQIEEDFDD